MKTLYTPGPWEYDPDESEIKSTVDVFIHEDVELDIPRMMTAVADLRGAMSGNDTRADAYLMAAAPELYEVLEDILKTIEGGGRIVTFQDSCIEDISAALSKARGERRTV